MLLSNPLAYPLLPSLGLTLVGLFASSLLALVISARGHWHVLVASVLFARWRAWLVIAPIFVAVVLSGVVPLAAFAAVLAVQGSREYARLTDLPSIDRQLLLGISACVPLLAIVAPTSLLGPALLAVPLLLSLPVILGQDVERGVPRLTRLVFGVWYLPVALSTLVLLERDARGGPGLLLALGLAVALSDVGAFTTGRIFGRRPLAPRLSPAKTWAGVVGNVLGAALGVGLVARAAPDAPLVLLVPVVAIGAVWGDLLESALKRAAQTKDSGACLPGFGGLLDRIDSLLVVLPFSYVLLTVTR
ncbi:MAG TPA: phosphatidate cytidylyltransferase [Chloroflexota bacterium]|nr:phosphatidate cytidylyltransferase [Chloroflexota bacterium]